MVTHMTSITIVQAVDKQFTFDRVKFKGQVLGHALAIKNIS